ncbi:MAG: Gfo/Idh/MocA family oxidoreductase [Verrucomicrobiota bacterium]|nr:Gfo/Idh/MocA family oxidoreductase [Verrucomicrobiota bacterium]
MAEPDCEITHLCDVREAVLTQRGAEVKEKTGRMPKLVKDYRELLDDPTVDAFMVATPDHWHALLTIEGCLAGKDVYVEKPASHNILEGAVAVAAARKRDRMVQMGTQIRSAAFLREAREYVQSGALGKVISGKAWETGRSSPVHLVADGAPPPGIDYHLWQGPSPERPYNHTIVEGAWRWMFDYGTGDLGNDGVHRIDYCRYVMGLDGFPKAISSSGGKFFFEDDQQWPDTLFVTYDYPGQILQYEMRLWSKPKLFGAGEGGRDLRREWLDAAHEYFMEGLRLPGQGGEGRPERQWPASSRAQFSRRGEEPEARIAQSGNLLRPHQQRDVSRGQHRLAHRQEAALQRGDRDLRRRGGERVCRSRASERIRAAEDRVVTVMLVAESRPSLERNFRFEPV